MAIKYQQTFSCFKCSGLFQRTYEVGSNVRLFVDCELCGLKEKAFAISGGMPKKTPQVRVEATISKQTTLS